MRKIILLYATKETRGVIIKVFQWKTVFLQKRKKIWNKTTCMMHQILQFIFSGFFSFFNSAEFFNSWNSSVRSFGSKTDTLRRKHLIVNLKKVAQIWQRCDFSGFVFAFRYQPDFVRGLQIQQIAEMFLICFLN